MLANGLLLGDTLGEGSELVAFTVHYAYTGSPLSHRHLLICRLVFPGKIGYFAFI